MSVDVDAQNEVEAQIIRRKKLIYQHPNLKKKSLLLRLQCQEVNIK